jgi:hypothetical protein
MGNLMEKFICFKGDDARSSCCEKKVIYISKCRHCHNIEHLHSYSHVCDKKRRFIFLRDSTNKDSKNALEILHDESISSIYKK